MLELIYGGLYEPSMKQLLSYYLTPFTDELRFVTVVGDGVALPHMKYAMVELQPVSNGANVCGYKRDVWGDMHLFSYPTIGELYIGGLDVYPPNQSKGYGKAFLDLADTVAKRLHLPVMSLKVYTLNTRAIEFYVRNGFTNIPERTEFVKWADEVSDPDPLLTFTRPVILA